MIAGGSKFEKSLEGPRGEGVAESEVNTQDVADLNTVTPHLGT